MIAKKLEAFGFMVSVVDGHSPEEIEKAFNEPRYLEIIRPDELKFVDLEKCLSFVTEEVPIA